MVPEENPPCAEVFKPAESNPSGLPVKDSIERRKLRSWLSKNFRIKMTDNRILIGVFLCTDRDANIILGICSEFRDEEERFLGSVIVPKKHIVSIEVDTKEMEDQEIM
ncbi:CLUMA_CG013010, isoform A [Clunio marinus]|uniref:CLUMA_CG013010, isoform A n=1 Tax=Clunio marinus TaxID=568069 RepID=A0A1J1IKS3_9DIPT|nr:CLUMA_CG013010, isoform A [Clunio marinus]